jgi:hypothetical protein
MADIPDSDFDEDAAFAAQENIAARPLNVLEAAQEERGSPATQGAAKASKLGSPFVRIERIVSKRA